MYKFSDFISSVLVEMYLIQTTSLSCVRLSDVNSTSGLHLRILSRLTVVIHTTASRDPILRCSPDVEITADSRTQLIDVIWIKYISTTTEEM